MRVEEGGAVGGSHWDCLVERFTEAILVQDAFKEYRGRCAIVESLVTIIPSGNPAWRNWRRRRAGWRSKIIHINAAIMAIMIRRRREGIIGRHGDRMWVPRGWKGVLKVVGNSSRV